MKIINIDSPKIDYLPKKFQVEIDNFSLLQGVLRIHVVQAKHLMKKDIGVLGKGKSDPYAVITVGAQEFRTKTIDNTVDPKWDYWCEVCYFILCLLKITLNFNA